MGAWGEGMQANDTAWDAIGDAGFNVNDQVPKKTAEKLNRKPAEVAKYFEAWEDEPWAILGLAEYFLDGGVDISAVRDMVKTTIQQEIDIAEDWKDSELRVKALETFRDRLDGKEVDMKEVEHQNRGLLERMLEGKPPKKHDGV